MSQEKPAPFRAAFDLKLDEMIMLLKETNATRKLANKLSSFIVYWLSSVVAAGVIVLANFRAVSVERLRAIAGCL